MKISLRNWATKWWRKPTGRKRKRAKLLAACLTLGLATAWAAPASGVMVHLSVSPTETIQQAFAVYYLQNSSGLDGYYQSLAIPLGTLLGGQTQTFDYEYPSLTVEQLLLDAGTLQALGPRWGIVGLHGNPDVQGLTLSFPNEQPIANGDTYESLIAPNLEPGYVIHYSLQTEAAIVDHLFSITGYAPEVVEIVRQQRSQRVVDYLGDLVQLPFGQEATLVNFTNAAFGGTAIATVPEPATWVLFVTGAGVVVVAARRRVT